MNSHECFVILQSVSEQLTSLNNEELRIAIAGSCRAFSIHCVKETVAFTKSIEDFVNIANVCAQPTVLYAAVDQVNRSLNANTIRARRCGFAKHLTHVLVSGAQTCSQVKLAQHLVNYAVALKIYKKQSSTALRLRSPYLRAALVAAVALAVGGYYYLSSGSSEPEQSAEKTDSKRATAETVNQAEQQAADTEVTEHNSEKFPERIPIKWPLKVTSQCAPFAVSNSSANSDVCKLTDWMTAPSAFSNFSNYTDVSKQSEGKRLTIFSHAYPGLVEAKVAAPIMERYFGNNTSFKCDNSGDSIHCQISPLTDHLVPQGVYGSPIYTEDMSALLSADLQTPQDYYNLLTELQKHIAHRMNVVLHSLLHSTEEDNGKLLKTELKEMKQKLVKENIDHILSSGNEVYGKLPCVQYTGNLAASCPSKLTDAKKIYDPYQHYREHQDKFLNSDAWLDEAMQRVIPQAGTGEGEVNINESNLSLRAFSGDTWIFEQILKSKKYRYQVQALLSENAKMFAQLPSTDEESNEETLDKNIHELVRKIRHAPPEKLWSDAFNLVLPSERGYEPYNAVSWYSDQADAKQLVKYVEYDQVWVLSGLPQLVGVYLMMANPPLAMTGLGMVTVSQIAFMEWEKSLGAIKLRYEQRLQLELGCKAAVDIAQLEKQADAQRNQCFAGGHGGPLQDLDNVCVTVEDPLQEIPKQGVAKAINLKSYLLNLYNRFPSIQAALWLYGLWFRNAGPMHPYHLRSMGPV